MVNSDTYILTQGYTNFEDSPGAQRICPGAQQSLMGGVRQ